MKVVGVLNQEKALAAALAGAFSVIVKTNCETDGSSAALHCTLVRSGWAQEGGGLQWSQRPANGDILVPRASGRGELQEKRAAV